MKMDQQESNLLLRIDSEVKIASLRCQSKNHSATQNTLSFEERLLQGSSSLISPSDADWLVLAPEWLFLAHLTVGPPPPPPAPRHLRTEQSSSIFLFQPDYLAHAIYFYPSFQYANARRSLRHLIPTVLQPILNMVC
jgi:hypothetical protein